MLPEEIAYVNYDKLVFDVTYGAMSALKDQIEYKRFDHDLFQFYKHVLLEGLDYFERKSVAF